MSDFNFHFGQKGFDPLLGPSRDFSTQIKELDMTQRAIEQKKAEIMRLSQQVEQEQVTQSKTPIWDEIDSLTGGMTEEEFEVLQSAPEYQESSAALMNLVAATQLQMLRPYVEQSAEGKKVLEQHLTNIKFLRKSASAEADKKFNDFKEYTEKYSHMSYDDYLKMKEKK